MNDRGKSTSTAGDDDWAEKEETTHGSPVEVLEEPVYPDEEATSPSTAKIDDELSKAKSTERTKEVQGSSASEGEERITEPDLPNVFSSTAATFEECPSIRSSDMVHYAIF